MSHRHRLPARAFAAGLLATTMLAGFSGAAHAQTVTTFRGDNSSDWFDPGNWSTNKAPDVGDFAGIGLGANPDAVIDNGDAFAQSLGIGYNDGSLTISNGSLTTTGTNYIAYTTSSNGDTSQGRLIMQGGSNWNANGGLLWVGLAQGNSGTFEMHDGATASLGQIGVGIDGAKGRVTVDSGAMLTTGDIRLGDIGESGTIGTGSALVTGQNSQWIASGIDIDNGSMEVDDRAHLTTGVAGSHDFIGVASGALYIDNALWTSNADDVAIGYRVGQGDSDLTAGTGNLVLQNDGDAQIRSLDVGIGGGNGTISELNNSHLVATGDVQIGGMRSAAGVDSPGSGTVQLLSGSTILSGHVLADGSHQGFVGIGTGAGAIGTVTIDGQLSAWTAFGAMTIGRDGGTGSIALTDGGALTTDALTLGDIGGIGTLSADDADINTTDVAIGAAGTGSATLANGSDWLIDGSLQVGGGQRIPDTPDGTPGAYVGSGSVKIGTGSMVTVNGEDGIGMLVGTGNRSSGSVDVGDPVGDVPAELDVAGIVGVGVEGGTGTLLVHDNGVVDLTGPDALFYIGVGNGGDDLETNGATSGVVSVVSGGQVTVAGATYVGYGPHGTGMLTVAGPGSAFTGTDFEVGLAQGAGSATISDRATLTTTGDAAIGTFGGIGSLTLEDGGSAWRHAGAVFVGVGEGGDGTLAIANDATLTVTPGTSGFQVGADGGTGRMAVMGAGTIADLGDTYLLIGATSGDGNATDDMPGNGMVSVTDSGQLTAGGYAFIGAGTGSIGALSVDGANSILSLRGGVTAGESGGHAAIRITNGAQATFGTDSDSFFVMAADNSDAVATLDILNGGALFTHGNTGLAITGGSASVNVAGPQSSWTDDGGFYTGNAHVVIADGARLETDGAQIGVDPAAPADAGVTVTGAGSTWRVNGDLSIGAFELPGDASFTPGSGSAFIRDGGTLAVAGGVSVGAAGGNGTLGVRAGTSVTMTTYDQSATGILAVGVDPLVNGRAGLVESAGGATLADGTHILVGKEQAGAYQLGNSYEILSGGAGGITHGDIVLDGDTRRSLFIGLVPEFAQGPQGEALYLDVEQDRTFASVAGTPNQIAAAGGADSLGDANALKTALLDLQTEAEAQGAFDQISGEIYPTIRTALIEDSRLPREAVLDRLREAPDGAGAWLQAVGNWGSNESDGNAARLDRNTKGVLAGIDTVIGDTLRIGISGGYTDSNLDVDARHSHADMTSYHALGYLGGDFGALRLRAGAGYSHSDVDTHRTIAFAGYSDALTASYDGSVLQGFGELGYSVPVSGGAIEPFAGVSVVRAHTGGVNETGGAAALSVDGDSQTSTASTLGLHASTSTAGPISATATLGWQHRFGDLMPTSLMQFDGSDSFTIAGTPLSKDAAVAELAVGWRIAPNMTVGARYSGVIGGHSVDNSAKATLSFAF